MSKLKTTPKEKRTFKPVTSSIEWVKTSELKKGETIEGTISEMRVREAVGKFKEQRQIILESEDGKLIGLPSHAIINNNLIGEDGKKFDEMKGTYVRLTYEGQGEKRKGKSAGLHLWKVEIAE